MAIKETMFFLILIMLPVSMEAKRFGKARMRAIFSRDSGSSGDTCTDTCIVKCCPSGWVRRGESCYYVDDTSTSKWGDARATCQLLGGDLAVIKSAEKNDFLFKLVTEQPTVTKGKAWIGLEKHADDSKWYWIDGTPLEGNYQNWNAGEPNNAGGHEDCAHFYESEGGWNDHKCEMTGEWLGVDQSPVILCEMHL